MLPIRRWLDVTCSPGSERRHVPQATGSAMPLATSLGFLVQFLEMLLLLWSHSGAIGHKLTFCLESDSPACP
jgi:hypothetical protein